MLFVVNGFTAFSYADDSLMGLIQYTGNLTSDGVNVRKGPGTNYACIDSNAIVFSSENYDILGSETNDSNEVWIKIQVNENEIGYVRSDLFSINALDVLDVIETGNVLKTLEKGTEITVLDYSTKENKDSKGTQWYKIKTSDNIEGYISSRSVKINVSDDFETYLTVQGFPESYKPYLRQLHSEHPNWIFKAVDTGIEWSDAIKAESYVPAAGTPHRVVLKSSYEAYRSADKYSYDLVTGTYYTKADGGSYYAASELAVAFYMDPRNFLTERSIFMFLLLGYDSETQTKEGLQAMLNGTFMQGEFPEDTFDTWADCIMYCAAQSKVSPYEIASTILQEQGVSGIGGSISGTISGYEGYYNFFNISASGANAVERGLLYARGGSSGTGTSFNRPWNSRFKSILGGALWHAYEYISDGQNTKYFVNWDVNRGLNNLASHQYATYIGDTLSKTNFLYESYASFLETSLVFTIPVYKNMPQTACKNPTTGNNINYLKSITLDGFTLNQTFDPYTYSYDLLVDPNVESIDISTEIYGTTATVTGNGIVKLLEGSGSVTKHNIVVTSSSGLERTYTISIAKGKGGQMGPIQYSTELTFGDYITGVYPETKYSKFIELLSVTDGSVIVYDKNGVEMSSGTISTGCRVVLKDRDDQVIKDIKVVSRGDLNGDGKITTADLLFIRKHLTSLMTLADEYLASCDINNDGKVTTADLLFIRKYIVGTYEIVQ